jgi:hypothetical protein
MENNNSSIKLESLRAKNFGPLSTFEIVYNKDGITRLIGLNGSGKTTVGLTAFWACLKGIAESDRGGNIVGKRFRFIGSEQETADLEIILYDEIAGVKIKITNKISETNGKNIKIKAPAGYVVDKKWIDNLLSMSFLSAQHFTNLTSQEQALALKIDTSEYDKSIKELKGDFTKINRESTEIGSLDPVAKVEKVLVTVLLDQKDGIVRFNGVQEECQKSIDETEKDIVEAARKLNELQTTLRALSKPEPLKDVTEIDARIANIDDINNKAEVYRSYVEKRDKLAAVNVKLGENKKKQAEKAQERLDYIKTFKLPMEGLTIDDGGGLLLDNRQIKPPFFSRGELEMIVADLFLSTNPKFLLRFIDDFEVLDKNNQEKIVNKLLEKGFQIITAEVGDEVKKENTVLLRECEIVN